jgi:hypothetical protein
MLFLSSPRDIAPYGLGGCYLHIFCGAMEKHLVSLATPAVDFLSQFSWIGEATYVLKVPAIDAAVAPVAASMGMDLTLIKYMITLFAAYPLMVIFRFLPGKLLKHIMSAGVGAFFVQWVFGPDWIHSFVAATLTYLICALGPKKSVGSIVYFVVLGYMVGCHAYRMYVNYLAGTPYHMFPLDFTGIQMVITMKLTSFGYNVQDGYSMKSRAPVAGDDKLMDKKAVAAKKLWEKRAKYAIKKLPNPLEFFSYAFCFAQLMVGPAFEFTDFIASLDSTHLGSGPSNLKVEDNEKPAFLKGKNSVTDMNAGVAAIHRMLLGVACMAGYLYLNGNGYSTHHAYDTTWIASRDWWVRGAFIYVCMCSERFKFYFIWKMSEGANILGGFGFQGYEADGKTALGFRGVENIDILGFEFSTSVQTLSRAWNKGTQAWLERYTYSRTGRSVFITYFVSAIWHGLYPGFFLFFLSVPVLTEIERDFKAKINPMVVPAYDGRNVDTYPKGAVPSVYWFLCWVGKLVAMNYVTQTFSMGYLVNSMTALGSYNHVPHITFVALAVVLKLIPGPKKKKE